MKGKDYGMEDWTFKLFGSIEPSNGFFCGIIIAQIIVFYLLNMLIDHFVMRGFSRRSNHTGAEPPLLDVRNDVKEHEQDVKNNSGRMQDDDQSF
jgi:hypothetical protein